MNPDGNETSVGVCEKAYNPTTAKPYAANLLERIIWKNVLLFSVYHAGFIAAMIIYGFGLHSVPVKWWTIVWMFASGYGSALGITAGVHRLWSHRSYKANLRLQILLMLMYSSAGMTPIFTWVRDHRTHHKYSDTNADPHNVTRGFFFAHCGWLLQERHPECIRRAREINMRDLLGDPVIVFNKKYVTELKWIFCFIIPTAVPVIFWGENILNAVLTQCVLRYLFIQHFTWSVNSIAHIWGTRPYNKFINPAENIFVSLLSGGEGSHNYHHTFPWDYKASELPYFHFSIATLFINAMAKLGWAYDLRTPSPDLVKKVIRRVGYKSELKEIY